LRAETAEKCIDNFTLLVAVYGDVEERGQNVKLVQNYFGNKLTYVSHRINHGFPCFSSFTGKRRLDQLFRKHRCKKTAASMIEANDANKNKHITHGEWRSTLPVWACVNNEKNSIDMYGSDESCAMLRKDIENFEAEIVKYTRRYIDHRIKIKTTVAYKKVKKLIRNSEIKFFCSEPSHNGKSYIVYVSGFFRQIAKLKKMLRPHLEKSKKMDYRTRNSCFCCGAIVSDSNHGMCSSVCGHVVCYICLSSSVIKKLRHNGCRCCAPKCNEKLPLSDIPFIAFIADELKAILKCSYDNFESQPQEKCVVRCPTKDGSELQRAESLASAPSMSKGEEEEEEDK